MIQLMLHDLSKYAQDQATAHGSQSRLTRIVLTMGGDGVLVLDNEEFTHFPCEPVDTSEI